MLLRFLIVLALAATSSCAGLKTDVTVCDLLENPGAYSGKYVKVRGTYNAGFEHSYLASCSKCSVEGNIKTDFRGLKKEDVEKMRKQFQKTDQYADLVAYAVFIARVKEAETFGIDGRPEQLLEVQSIESAEVLYNEITNYTNSEKRAMAKKRSEELCRK